MSLLPTSVSERLLQAIEAACVATAMANVYRSRESAVERSEGLTVIVTPFAENTSAFDDRLDRNDFDVSIEIIARGTVPDQVADPLCIAINEALIKSPAINALCHRIRRTSRVWAMDEADETALVLTLKYRCIYLCSASDITAQPTA